MADNRDGTYTNPIIDADYSDPDVIRVGDDFYLTASSFNSIPGLPILHSKDLVNWKIIGHALQRQIPEDVFARPQHGNGVWAPSIRFHDNYFWIFYGDPDFGIYMLKARNAAGPWSEPLLIRAAKGWIDTCPFWDDDGNAYLVHAWANSRSGIKSILTINRMSADGTKLLDDGRMVFDVKVSVVGEAICNFSYSTDGKRFQSVGDIFVAKPGMWIGAKVGLFALAPHGAETHGYADYEWFRF